MSHRQASGGTGDRRGDTGLPAHLPRQRVELPVEPALRTCSVCGAEQVCIGHETSEVLELIPSQLLAVSKYRGTTSATPAR